MQVRDFEPSDLEGVHQLLATHGWAHRIEGTAHLQRLVQASQRTAVASVAHQTVGFARAITDGMSNGYVSMVVVAQPWQRRGVGRALVQHILGADPGITWVLRAGRAGAPAFFARLGFEPSTAAMELTRR